MKETNKSFGMAVVVTALVYMQGRSTRTSFSISRAVIADNALTVQRELGLNPALMVHGELVYVVDEDAAPGILNDVQSIMRTPPEWWPELVTWSEGSIGNNYGEAK